MVDMSKEAPGHDEFVAGQDEPEIDYVALGIAGFTMVVFYPGEDKGDNVMSLVFSISEEYMDELPDEVIAKYQESEVVK